MYIGGRLGRGKPRKTWYELIKSDLKNRVAEEAAFPWCNHSFFEGENGLYHFLLYYFLLHYFYPLPLFSTLERSWEEMEVVERGGMILRSNYNNNNTFTLQSENLGLSESSQPGLTEEIMG